MTTVERLYNEALALSEEERRELVARLSEGGPPITGPETIEELMLRAAEARSGRVKGMTLEEVEAGLDRVRARHRASQR